MKKTDTKFLYQAVENFVEKAIATRNLKPGQKILSIRKMAEMHKVSTITVMQAYYNLEKRGLLEAKPNEGFFVKKPFLSLPMIPGSITQPKYSARVESGSLISNILMASRDKFVVPLAVACPDPNLFQNNSLNKIVRSILREDPFHSSSYEFPPGLDELREEIAKRSVLSHDYVTADQVIVTSGAMEAISLALRVLTVPGDVIAIESPTYFGIIQILESLKLSAIEIPHCPEGEMDVEAFKKAASKRKISACIVIPNFSNPTGAIMSDASKKQLVKVAESLKIPLIENDVFGDLAFDNTKPRSLRSFSDSLGSLCKEICSSKLD